MPLPEKTNKDQTNDEFIASCMSSEVMKREFKNNKQRLAVCFSQLRKSKKKKSKGSIDNINWEDIEKSDAIILD